MDALTLSETTWRAVPAWKITGSQLELIITQTGGHLAAIRFIGEDINPLWQPAWHAADPNQVTVGGYYGGIEAGLLAAIVGHNVCIDRFGPAHANEERPVHGEAGVGKWSVMQVANDLLEFTVALPLAGFTARKHVQLAGNKLHLTHAVFNPGKERREIEWCEHINCGQPFIDFATCEAGVDKIYNWHGEPEPMPRFPAIPSLGDMPVQDILKIPTPDEKPCGDVVAGPVKTGHWSITNPTLKRKLSCTWQVSDFPWLTIWTQHRSRPGTPWFNRERTRGMELTTKPFPNGSTDPEVHPSFKGVTTVCHVAPGQWKAHPIVLTWERL